MGWHDHRGHKAVEKENENQQPDRGFGRNENNEGDTLEGVPLSEASPVTVPAEQ